MRSSYISDAMFITYRIALLIIVLAYGELIYGATTAADSIPVKCKGSISMYVEGYINGVSNAGVFHRGKMPPFFYNYNRKNTPAVNLAILKYSYDKGNIRFSGGLQVGTYVHDNYLNENKYLKHISDFYGGIRLKNDTWIEVGIFSSYIGFESNIGADNYNASRSILAENSPYYVTGARVTNSISNKVNLNAYLLTGWQRIKPIAGMTLPALGWQLQYKIANNNLLNWSTFIGTEYPDSSRRMRYFNNLYWQKTVGQINIIAGLDLGFEQIRKAADRLNCWVSPIMILQFPVTHSVSTAFRIERYCDPKGVIVGNGGCDINSVSANIDYHRFTNILLRFEARTMFTYKQMLLLPDGIGKQLTSFLISASYRLKKQ